MEEIHSWTAKMLWGQCWENTEGEGFHLPFTPKEGYPEEGPFSRHYKLNKDSACTWKWGVVCCAERALCREPCAGAMNSFMVPQSMDACWNFYHYRALKEHCQVTGTFQRKQRDQLRSNPCSGVHGWDRRRATCCAESKCNSTRVRVLPRTHKDSEWLTLPGEKRESYTQRQGPMSAKGVTRNGRRHWHSSR